LKQKLHSSSNSIRLTFKSRISRSWSAAQPWPMRTPSEKNSTTVNASQAFGSANADAFGKGRDGFDLFFTGKNVHGA